MTVNLSFKALQAYKRALNTYYPLIPVPHPTNTATASLDESNEISSELSNNFQLVNVRSFFSFYSFFDRYISASVNGKALGPSYTTDVPSKVIVSPDFPSKSTNLGIPSHSYYSANFYIKSNFE